MKKFIIFLLILIILLSPAADALIGSKGLKINGGINEIILQRGEKMHLWASDALTGLPVIKPTYYSDHPLIASIGKKSGILRAHLAGTAHITITSQSGRSGYLKVTVYGGKKTPLLWIFLIINGLIFFLYIIFKK